MNEQSASRLAGFLENPRRALWTMSLPMMVGMSLQTAYLLADMYFVGRIGPDALAALAFNMPLVFLGLGIVFGLGSGVTSVIARHIGADDKSLADSSAEHSLALGVLLSVAFTAVAYVFGREILASLGVTPELLPLAWDYFSVLAAGYVFIVMTVFFRSILAGEGDMKTPMMIQALAFSSTSNGEGSRSRSHAAAAARLMPNSMSTAKTALPERTTRAAATAKARR